MTIFARRAYLEGGWKTDVTVTVKNGCICKIDIDAPCPAGATQVDTLLPALANLHSHSFQRAMAGMTEYRAKGRESFWTWRELMYRYLDQLTPDHIGAIAELAFMEMVEAGYAAVGEFHYIHHAPGGAPYDDIAEISNRIMQAASETGIGLTHLPVLYTYGGVDGRALEGGQLRFGNTVERFLRLVEDCRGSAAALPDDAKVGVAPHSLRATSHQDLSALLAATPDGPVHIHIAEQEREVVEVQSQMGARPVEWLLNTFDIDARWCLIHATHMTQAETRGVAQSGAVAGLCPVTEANLGDGVFSGAEYLNSQGALGVGTDSNINISVTEELRMLEYSQRLTHMERNVLVPEDGSVGQTLYLAAAAGGARSLNRNAGSIKIGKLADLVAVDSHDPALCTLSDRQLFDGMIFAANDRVVTDVWSAGRHLVRDGHHIARDRIIANYRQSMAGLTPN